jgi:hypothetical protein
VLSPIVHQVLSQNKIPHSKEVVGESMCDACQKGKSHQLPFGRSISVSKAHLELVFSDVWGPALSSVGRFKYYVPFINDFSNFTWFYLFKHKSDVFQKFKEFQQFVERLFNKKILAVQTDWGGEYQKLSPFFPEAKRLLRR